MSDVEQVDEKEGVESYLEKGKYLPYIHRVALPKTTTQSALIRWLWALGYPVKDISKGLDIRYQQVRNIINTQPKRATREDMPPLEIRLLEMEDAVDMLLDMELERTFLEERKQDKKSKRGSGSTEVYDEEEDNDA